MVYAISDVHGDVKRAKELLAQEGLINKKGRWSGGSNQLVVCGDSVDRGDFGYESLELFMHLEREAQMEGGSVVYLLGNHDLWLIGMARMRDEKDPVFKRVYQGWRAGGGKVNDLKKMVVGDPVFEWLITRPVMCRIGDVLYQHADAMMFYVRLSEKGISGDEMIKSINAKVTQVLADPSSEGAWYLGNEMTCARDWDRNERLVPNYLTMFGVDKVVHGHSPNGVSDLPMYYLQGRVILIDGIMSDGYGRFRGEPDPNRGVILALESTSTYFIA